MKTRTLCAGIALTMLMQLAHAEQITRRITPPPDWLPAGERTSPPAPDGLPAAAAGCLVIGQHVLVGGTTAKSRVMQGGFTKDVPPAAQQAFTDSALAVAASWRYRQADPKATPDGGFETVVVGFGAGGSTSPASKHGVAEQDERVRAACDIGSLADWGNRNAIAVEQATAPAGGDVLVRAPRAPDSFWVPREDNAIPRYPERAIRGGMMGCVVVGYVVSGSGEPSQFRIMKSADAALGLPKRSGVNFDGAALSAVTTWRFAPGPDNLSRLPEFRQSPVSFSLGRRGDREQNDCRADDPRQSVDPGSL